VLDVAWTASEQLTATPVVDVNIATPVVDVNIMRRPTVWTNDLVVLLLGGGMYCVFGLSSPARPDPGLGQVTASAREPTSPG
jgi:hypothetical protein